MDAYEATKVVFSRIQALDPDHAAKIMGFLLVQDHGEKEMIRLAFGPELLLQSVMAKARRELGLLPASAGPASPLQLSRQNSGRGGAPSPLSVSSPSSWAQAPAFSRGNGFAEGMAGAGEEMMMSPVNGGAAPFFSRAGNTPVDDFQQQEELAFQNEAGMNPFRTFDGAECRSPGPGDGMFPYGLGWANGGVPGHRRSSSANEACLAGDGFGWKPCLYYARGFCKNGSGCRFVHAGGLPDDDAALAAAAEQQQQQCQDFLLRSRSQRLGHPAFPYSPTGSLPGSPSAASKCLSFLLQQQHNDNQRAAAALMLGGGGDETHKFMGRPRLDRADFASIMNPGSRQIYLTFPADSTFREEDVSGYFSMYGPVHDVRIPYQQKRMFGFVTFMHPETVRLILAKGNPHFICDARVLVKPYKEKGKIPDKYRKQGDFSGCTTPTGLDGRDPFDLHQLGGRMLQHSNSANELMMRRKLEDEQQAAEFQHAVELQSRRLMSLQLLDLKSRVATAAAASTAMAPTTTVANASTTTSQPGASTAVQSQPDSDQQLNGSNFCANEGGNKEESTDDANRNTDSDQKLIKLSIIFILLAYYCWPVGLSFDDLIGILILLQSLIIASSVAPKLDHCFYHAYYAAGITTCRKAHSHPQPSRPHSLKTATSPVMAAVHPITASAQAPMQVVALTIYCPQHWIFLLRGPTSSPCPGCPPITEQSGCETVLQWKVNNTQT